MHAIRVKFVYEGHLVKVKVTGAKKVENHPVSQRNGILRASTNPDPRRLKIQSPITPRLGAIIEQEHMKRLNTKKNYKFEIIDNEDQ